MIQEKMAYCKGERCKCIGSLTRYPIENGVRVTISCKKFLLEEIRCASFMQELKMLIWKSMERGKFPEESALDEIAVELFDKFIRKDLCSPQSKK